MKLTDPQDIIWAREVGMGNAYAKGAVDEMVRALESQLERYKYIQGRWLKDISR